MSGETHSRHCWWLMLVVSLAHSADAGSGKVGQRRRVLSALPETMVFPSGLNATLRTVAVGPVSGGPIGWPVAASHSRTVLSSLPETMRLPSGLNTTLITLPVWPVIGAPTGWPVA